MRASRFRRLGVGAIGLAVLVGVLVAAGAGQASGVPDLPPITPERLIASTLRSLAQHGPVSGTMVAHLDLGIPSLPDIGGATGPAGLLASLGGDHRLRVWRSRDGFRLAELEASSERALFVSRTEAWAWDFSSFTAYRLGTPGADGPPQAVESPVPPLDVAALARRALDAVTPSTIVSLDRNAMVAGRPSYVLVLEPRTPQTLVGRIEIAVDAERGLPLRVAVIPRGRTAAAVSVGFTSVGFGPIDPAVYRFTPPPGAAVRTLPVAGRHHGQGGPPAIGSAGSSEGAKDEAGSAEYAPRVFGSDWATIVAVRTPPPSDLGTSAAGGELRSFLPFQGPLLSIRLVDRGDHGWLVYGLVPAAALAAVEPKLN